MDVKIIKNDFHYNYTRTKRKHLREAFEFGFEEFCNKIEKHSTFNHNFFQVGSPLCSEIINRRLITGKDKNQ